MPSQAMMCETMSLTAVSIIIEFEEPTMLSQVMYETTSLTAVSIIIENSFLEEPTMPLIGFEPLTTSL